MNTQSLLGKIVTVVAVLVLASLLLSLVLGLIGGLIGLIFRFGIPLLLAVLIVRWLTNVRQRPKNISTKDLEHYLFQVFLIILKQHPKPSSE